MAKIDLSTIEGYAEMSAEDKLKALENFNLPDPDYTGYVRKDLFDKKASELAEANKKLNEKLSDEDRVKQEQEQKMADLENEVASLKKEKRVSAYRAKYIAQGMDEKLANETAEALESGDHEKVFANEKVFLEALSKKIKTDALGELDKPPAGGGGSDEPKDVKYAKELAKKEAEANKSFAEGMKNFL